MSFLTGPFDYDAFISYSHVDNLGDDSWVEGFHKQLEIALARRVGRIGAVTIWRDKRVEGNQLFDQTIKGAVQKAALFIALTSNGYLESDYCLQELKWFHEKAIAEPFGLQVGDRSRIYNVLLTVIPPARWPNEYGRMSGFTFHDAESDDDLGEPTDATLDKQRYKHQLSAIADSLFRMLLAFKEHIDKTDVATPRSSDSTQAQNPTRGEGSQSVFVADVADSLASLRKRIVSELQRKGVSVDGGIPPPYSAPAHEQRVAAVTQGATLSVHLLDQIDGREIDGDPGRSYPQRQVELVRAQRRPQLIWVPKSLDTKAIESERYRDFLEDLENGDRKQSRYDFIRGASSALASQILDTLAQLQSRTDRVNGGSQSVLLDTHLKDQLYAFEIGRLLLESHVQPYINPQEDDPTKNLDSFEGRLAQVSSLAIVYGNVSESWVRQRLGVALQLSVVKNFALKSFCVVLVPPEKQSANVSFSFGPIAVRLIDMSGNAMVSRANLEPLLRSVRPGSASA